LSGVFFCLPISFAAGCFIRLSQEEKRIMMDTGAKIVRLWEPAASEPAKKAGKPKKTVSITKFLFYIGVMLMYNTVVKAKW